ncbi:uncharacterized protein LOC118276391 [Spodoptera frugiperda]|uniref:Uncharacterized protein LOC118276391 n=1 Tax=Spodoptera frugiperda TaxID=7108 RepID=A0A9R0DFJ3_SPOFR|nr:uncharacterized protein LOC118276391 [Spodoptera frugiperda]
MVPKMLALFVIAAALTQAQAVTQITLPDQYHTFLTNQLIGKSLSIPKSFLDVLQTCHVIFPNGLVYEAFPNNRLPAGPITFLHAAQPFTSCAIGFLGADVSLSGTYELMSLVNHSADNSLSLTRQRFHLTLVEIDPWKGDA